MREYFGGTKLWENSNAKILEEEKEQKVKKLKDQFLKRKQAREREIYEQLLASYQDKIAAYNKQYYKKQRVIRQPLRYIRITKRRASDGAIGLKRYFDPFYDKFDEQKYRKKLLKEEWADLEVIPIYRK